MLAITPRLLVPRLGLQRAIQLGSLVFAAGQLANGLAPTPRLFLLGICITALGTVCLPATVAFIANLAGEGERGALLGGLSTTQASLTLPRCPYAAPHSSHMSPDSFWGGGRSCAARWLSFHTVGSSRTPSRTRRPSTSPASRSSSPQPSSSSRVESSHIRSRGRMLRRPPCSKCAMSPNEKRSFSIGSGNESE